MKAPLIFDVRRGSTEDGPGIRTTVFFKGCNLRCAWCHNPESIVPLEEIGFYARHCIACGDCERACPEGACRVENRVRIERRLCTRCGACADACPAAALRRIGRPYQVEELMELLLMDAPFYHASGGGVTLSGGEPTLHMEYVSDLLRLLQERAVHTAIETNGLFAWDEFRDAILPYVDLIMMDVKVIDPFQHHAFTGASNEVMIENLQRLAREHGPRLLARVPLVPGFTATNDNLSEIAALFRSLGLARYALLPYNPTWFHKAAAIGRPTDPRLSARMLTRDELGLCKERFSGKSLSATLLKGEGSRIGRAASDKEGDSDKPNGIKPSRVKGAIGKVHRVQA